MPKNLIVFCGASSVGKDVIASRVQRQLRKEFGVELEFLDKYTSRTKRSEKESTPRQARVEGTLYEPSSTYEFLTPEDIAKNENCFFEYRKYGDKRYAFSKSHLESDFQDFQNLSCILGALHRAAEFRKRVEERFNRNVYMILIEAEKQELYDRLDLRNTFAPDERDRRRQEISKDIDRINLLKNTGEACTVFDLIIYNGGTSLPKTVETVTKAIGKWHGWLEWMYSDV